MASYPKLSQEILTNLCAVVADTSEGITGSQIGKFLASVGIKDLYPDITKRDRLFEALRLKQDEANCSNNVFAFLMNVMNPVNYTQNHGLFEARRNGINQVLLFAGYELTPEGKIKLVDRVKNLTEAERRADRLSAELHNRKVHAEVLKYCNPELLQKNYFHAVLEAVKGIASRIREMTGLVSDGAELIDEAFRTSDPYIIINSFVTDTEKSEHSGFMNLQKGIFGMFRNVTAHAAKIEWPIFEEEAFDLLTLVSLVHKKLDKATLVKTKK
ncbi:MAG: TIGR02391 family protein [Ignavibacteriaceae bacterium]